MADKTENPSNKEATLKDSKLTKKPKGGNKDKKKPASSSTTSEGIDLSGPPSAPSAPPPTPPTDDIRNLVLQYFHEFQASNNTSLPSEGGSTTADTGGSLRPPWLLPVSQASGQTGPPPPYSEADEWPALVHFDSTSTGVISSQPRALPNHNLAAERSGAGNPPASRLSTDLSCQEVSHGATHTLTHSDHRDNGYSTTRGRSPVRNVCSPDVRRPRRRRESSPRVRCSSTQQLSRDLVSPARTRDQPSGGISPVRSHLFLPRTQERPAGGISPVRSRHSPARTRERPAGRICPDELRPRSRCTQQYSRDLVSPARTRERPAGAISPGRSRHSRDSRRLCNSRERRRDLESPSSFRETFPSGSRSSFSQAVVQQNSTVQAHPACSAEQDRYNVSRSRQEPDRSPTRSFIHSPARYRERSPISRQLQGGDFRGRSATREFISPIRSPSSIFVTDSPRVLAHPSVLDSPGRRTIRSRSPAEDDSHLSERDFSWTRSASHVRRSVSPQGETAMRGRQALLSLMQSANCAVHEDEQPCTTNSFNFLGTSKDSRPTLHLAAESITVKARKEADFSIRGQSDVNRGKSSTQVDISLDDSLPSFKVPFSRAFFKRSERKPLLPRSELRLPEALNLTVEDKAFISTESVKDPSTISFSKKEFDSLYESSLESLRLADETTQVFRALLRECGQTSNGDPANFEFRDDANPALVGMAGLQVAESLLKSLDGAAVAVAQLTAKFRQECLSKSKFSSAEREQICAWPLHDSHIFNPGWAEQVSSRKRSRDQEKRDEALSSFLAKDKRQEKKSRHSRYPYKHTTTRSAFRGSSTQSSSFRRQSAAESSNADNKNNRQPSRFSRGRGRAQGRGRGSQASRQSQPFR